MSARRLSFAALACAALAWAAPAGAQDAAPGARSGRPTPLASPSPLGYAPPPPAPAPAPPAPSPFLDPGAGGWGPTAGPSAPPGLFFDAQLTLAFPAVKFTLQPNTSTPSGVTLRVPTVDLPLTVSPLFELGYRLPNGAGFFAGNYRFLAAEETANRFIGDVPAAVRTRLNINSWDLDYGVEPVEFAPRYTYSWRIGARLADVFFDNRAVMPGLTQQASNHYFGAGPHARIDIERRVVILPGLSLTAGLDGAVLVGQVRQRFREAFTAPPELLPVILLPAPTYQEARRSQAVPYLNVQLGASYVPPNLPNVKFTAGYQFEQYFNVGKLGVDGRGALSESRGEVWAHGLFLRGQVDF